MRRSGTHTEWRFLLMAEQGAKPQRRPGGAPPPWLPGALAVLVPPDGRARRALVPDLRGFGDSDVLADPTAYVVMLLDHLRLPSTGVCLHQAIPGVACHRLCLLI